ncbi:MAG: glycosyltransferase [Bacilli bacterium]
MNKYKVCVYAICKDEEKFVERWVNSMKEADEIYVLDTGSTDNTVKELRKRNVNVEVKKIEPWRFDVARNKSLELVPLDTDICVCTDLDEVFEKGWRNKLENAWNTKTTRARYNYNWNFDENGKPAVNFYIEKIHNRNNYKWTHPVHEVLTYIGNENESFITIDNITLNHYPDRMKSRGSYLPLLELSVKEDPSDDRNMHYLGREYMYYGKWNECIDTLIKHLNLSKATWKDERAASMRFIARSYKNLGRFEEAKMWLNKAIEEAPYLRDAYVERALLEYQLGNYIEVEKYCHDALRITSHQKTYINEVFSWDYTIYDLLSISLFYQNRLKESLIYSDMALMMNPKDDRLIKNNEIIRNQILDMSK